MNQGNLPRVEVYGQGGWWKDSHGRYDQVRPGQAGKGPLYAVAVLANQFGMDGWELTDVASQPHGGYHLAFELAYLIGG